MSVQSTPTLLWFRRDLRLADNAALAHAAANGGPVIPVFVLDEAAGRPMGGASRWWLDKTLSALAASLERAGSRLILRRGPAAEMIPRLAAETGVESVVWNRVFEPDAFAVDAAVRRALDGAGVQARAFRGALLTDPMAVLNGSGRPFQVFTAFWRAARSGLDPGCSRPAPVDLVAPGVWPASDRLDLWRLHPSHPDWSVGFSPWRPGEAGAVARLDAFLDQGLADYAEGRDVLAGEATSRLSPHLHWGEIGPRQIWRAVDAAVHAGRAHERQAQKVQAELGWREFASYLLIHFPAIVSENLRPEFDRMTWRDDAESLEAWRRGRTGYPVVDAAMRELWTTGFMHNRARMIAASFLVKHLGIDWRQGEAWFWDTLVDADLAANAMNWQWSAGSGVDAQPFFRVFNPVTQGLKFDADGRYVRRWAPELAGLSNEVLHAPWTATPEALEASGVVLGKTYPRPIVDHSAARARALAAFARTHDPQPD